MSALASDAEHVETLMACAELQKKCGMLTESAASLRQALAADAGNAAVCEALAVVLTDVGTPVISHLPACAVHVSEVPPFVRSKHKFIIRRPTHISTYVMRVC